MPGDGVFHTDSMALATVLALGGFTYDIRKIDDRTCLWQFEEPEDEEPFEKFHDIIDAYAAFRYTCEIRSFTTRFADMRREVQRIVRPRSRVSTPGV